MKNNRKNIFLSLVIFLLISIYTCSPPDDDQEPQGFPVNIPVFPYQGASFHESLWLESIPGSIFVAEPLSHRIAKYSIQSNTYSSANDITFDTALYDNGTTMGWYASDVTGDIKGLDTPVDFAFTSNMIFIWILDNNGLTKRNFADGSIAVGPFDYTGSTITECQNVLQIEYTNHLLALTKDAVGNFYICHFDEVASDFNLADAILMTHPETGRLVTNVPHFKANLNGIYIMQELELKHLSETPVFFLEKRDGAFLFESGIFLYEASGLSFYTDQVVVSGRQRNYEGNITILNANLDRISAYSLSVSPKLNGITHFDGFDLFINSFELYTDAVSQ